MTSVRVLIEPERLDPEGLRAMLEADGCGSVVSFVGLTRGEDDGVTVERLEFDAWEGGAPRSTERARRAGSGPVWGEFSGAGPPHRLGRGG